MVRPPDAGGRFAPQHKAAKRLSLTYVNDGSPGLTRKKTSGGFLYLDAKGHKLSEGKKVERIRALAIPPAWTDVWISPDPDGHIQATGRDDKGRKQYRYHDRWAAARDDVKYGSLVSFAERLPKLRAAMDRDLRKQGLPRERVLAAVVSLLDETLIRVGNQSYAKDNGSFGLTTLKDRHVAISGASLRFAFKGKSGKEWKLKLSDRRIARVVKGAQDLPGQHLFQYLDGDGNRRALKSDDVNAYIRDATGQDFTSKHFRTWSGTVMAAGVLAATELPETTAARRRVLNEAIDRVAHELGNTRAVCRRCYIHPAVIDDWEAGKLVRGLTAARQLFGKVPKGLEEEEATVRKWLERRGKRRTKLKQAR